MVQKKLKPVNTKEQWGEGLAAFRLRHKLGWRDLESICNNYLSRRSLHRIGNSLPIPRLVLKNVRSVIRDHLRTYLEGKGLSEAEIQAELRSIFTKEEIQPVITQRSVLSRDAQKFFSLRADPFPNEPPRSRTETFTTPQLDRIAGQLEDSINYQGFVAVIGDRGSGKSFMKRRVVDACERSQGKMHILWPEFSNMEKVHSGSICSFILHEFTRAAPRDLVDRYSRLKKLLAGLSNEGVRIALGFDECHRLDPRLLTALKNFWEIGSGGYDRYLGLILFGQPMFENTLRDIEFMEITERLDVIHMPNMRKHAWDYVSHRLKLVGGNSDKLFDRDAITRLADIAATPLALGNLANSALAKAHQLNERKVHKGVLTAMLGAEHDGEPRLRSTRRA